MTGADIYMKTCKEKALEWNVSPRSVMICAKRKNTGCNKRKRILVNSRRLSKANGWKSV